MKKEKLTDNEQNILFFIESLEFDVKELRKVFNKQKSFNPLIYQAATVSRAALDVIGAIGYCEEE